MKFVQTVKGPIPEDKLGKTLMHEHCVATSAATYLAVTDPDPKLQEFLNEPITPENRSRIFYYAHKHRENAENRDENLAITELKYFKAAGGSTVVDVTTPGIGRDVRLLERVSDATGLNIVTSTGLYTEETHPEKYRKMSAKELTALYLRELRDGVDDTGIKAGYIKVGMSDDWTDREVECLKAAGRAAAESGMSMTIHQPIFRTWGDRIVNILTAEGVEPDKIVLSHCDPTLYDFIYQTGLLERGVRLQFDEFQLEFPCTYGPYVKRWLPRDIERVRHIKKLCDLGFEDQLTVSMDMGAFKMVYRTYGGPGYAYLIDHLYPYFLWEGITEAQMEKILVKNPQHILAR